jgi:hypothetical protein
VLSPGACLSFCQHAVCIDTQNLAVRDAFRNDLETAVWYDLGEESTHNRT